MQKELTIQEKIEYAILNKRKIRFNVNEDTKPEFVVFHPYALSSLFENLTVVGLVEDAKEPKKFISHHKITDIRKMELLDINFQPNNGIQDNIERIQIIIHLLNT